MFKHNLVTLAPFDLIDGRIGSEAPVSVTFNNSLLQKTKTNTISSFLYGSAEFTEKNLNIRMKHIKYLDLS